VKKGKRSKQERKIKGHPQVKRVFKRDEIRLDVEEKGR